MTGGQNRTHGSTAVHRSIDSFALSCFLGNSQQADAVISWPDGAAVRVLIERERVVLGYEYRGKSRLEKLPLEWRPRGYGGENAYFMCPCCGGRYRKLYLCGGRFQCRKCSGLNYPTQQAGKLDVARRKVRRELKALAVPPERMEDGSDVDGWIPEKPRGMHYSTYYRHCRKLQQARREWYALIIRAARALLG